MEKKNQDDYVLNVMQWMGYANHVTVQPERQSGGLLLLWKEDVDLQVISSSPNYIEAEAAVKGKKPISLSSMDIPRGVKGKKCWRRSQLCKMEVMYHGRLQ